MPMKNPSHPGTVVLSECIEPLGLTITQAAQALGVTRTTLSELVNGKRGISPETSIRLSRVFGGSPKAGSHSRLTTTLRRFPPTAFNSNASPWLEHQLCPLPVLETRKRPPAICSHLKVFRDTGCLQLLVAEHAPGSILLVQLEFKNLAGPFKLKSRLNRGKCDTAFGFDVPVGLFHALQCSKLL